MAIDDADGAEQSAPAGDDAESDPARVGEYTWADYLSEYGAAGDARAVTTPDDDPDADPGAPVRVDWSRVDADVAARLGVDPARVDERVAEAAERVVPFHEFFEAFCDPETTPVVKDVYLWEHYKREYYYDESGDPPYEDGEKVPFDREEELGFDPDLIENALARGAERAEEMDELVDRRTVDVSEDLDEDAFFSTESGQTTVANRYDLEKAVPMEKKTHFREVERYWVNKPYSLVVLFHSTKENEKKYYVVEPYTNRIEEELEEFLTGKLRAAIKYDDDTVDVETDVDRQNVIEDHAFDLLERYDLYDPDSDGSVIDALARQLGVENGDDGGLAAALRRLGWQGFPTDDGGLDGIAARPEPAVLAEDPRRLTEYQVEKLLYALTRDFIGYERIDGIKHDINVEDISCDGYDSPVFVYHTDYEQIITNVYHGTDELDDFVVKLAQRSGKGISKRRPQVDATLPDGSRAQLTLGKEVSDHGTNYTIRQFKDVPFTPIDLINWHTFSLEEMAYLWLCIENHKSLIFAGGTASGKTTSLNAVSLFIPSNSKIVSIEDTREVELPQRNWVASVTRPSFSDDEKGDIDEFDLLEAALRQRPDYIVMGEVRGEEGRTLFQVMSTGHTTYTTFHADSVGEVLKRFTTDPINVSKTMFTALDLVSIQTSTRVAGNKVRRNKSLTEINFYDAENDEINVQDVYQWQAETDEYLLMGQSNTLDDIKFDRGWTQDRLDHEIFRREVVLAYLIDRGLNTYTEVAATFQAFINDPDTILTLMATDQLERSLEDLREMESVLIDIDPEKEEMVPRPDVPDAVREEAQGILEEADEELFEEFRNEEAGEVVQALLDVEEADDVQVREGGETPVLDEVAGAADSELGGEADGAADDGVDDATDAETTTPSTGGDSDVDTDGAAVDVDDDDVVDADVRVEDDAGAEGDLPSDADDARRDDRPHAGDAPASSDDAAAPGANGEGGDPDDGSGGSLEDLEDLFEDWSDDGDADPRHADNGDVFGETDADEGAFDDTDDDAFDADDDADGVTFGSDEDAGTDDAGDGSPGEE